MKRCTRLSPPQVAQAQLPTGAREAGPAASKNRGSERESVLLSQAWFELMSLHDSSAEAVALSCDRRLPEHKLSSVPRVDAMRVGKVGVASGLEQGQSSDENS